MSVAQWEQAREMDVLRDRIRVLEQQNAQLRAKYHKIKHALLRMYDIEHARNFLDEAPE